MNRVASARCASWMEMPCPVCGAVPGQRCRVAPGAFQAVFHRERAGVRKPPTPEPVLRTGKAKASFEGGLKCA
jgi:hypothetical protein